jgi:hypothetical protein
MKQLIFILIVLSSLASCGTFARQIRDANIRRNIYSVYNGVYIRDQTTGLCFFVVDAYQGASIACVPCDSLRQMDVKNIYILRK